MRTTCLILLAAMALNGCSYWQVQKVTPQQLIEERAPRSVRVRQHDGSGVTLKRPYFRSDTLLGQVGRDTVAVPVASVKSVSVRKGDTLANIVGASLFVVGVTFAALMIHLSNSW